MFKNILKQIIVKAVIPSLSRVGTAVGSSLVTWGVATGQADSFVMAFTAMCGILLDLFVRNMLAK